MRKAAPQGKTKNERGHSKEALESYRGNAGPRGTSSLNMYVNGRGNEARVSEVSARLGDAERSFESSPPSRILDDFF